MENKLSAPWHTITPYELDNACRMIGKDWMLVCAGDNAMTASWGGMGILWNKPVAFVFIRPQRYTLEFTEEAEDFSLSFFDPSHRPALTLCGRKSGREGDKIAEAGLHPADFEGVPSFTEAKRVLKVKKLYKDVLKPEGFLDPAIDAKNYPAKDYHVVYVCKILEGFEKEA